MLLPLFILVQKPENANLFVNMTCGCAGVIRNTEIWEQMDNTQRAAVLDRLAQLIAKAAETGTQPEGSSHE